MKQRNKGFTLMELIISIAIMAIVGGMLGGLLYLGTHGFKSVTQEENLQSDAQMVFSQIENYVIDADVSINYCVSASESDVGEAVLCDDEYTGGEISHKQLTIYSRDDNDSSKKKIQQVSWSEVFSADFFLRASLRSRKCGGRQDWLHGQRYCRQRGR